MKNSSASVTMFGAISIVNAIATGKGCTFGISQKVKVKISLEKGHQGISRNFVNDKLVNKIIRSILPSKILKNHFIKLPQSNSCVLIVIGQNDVLISENAAMEISKCLHVPETSFVEHTQKQY